MNNSTIKWENVRYFNKREFVDDVDKFADPKLIYQLDDFRDRVHYKIFPSPVPGSCVRMVESGSQHSAINRRSTAIDVFCDAPPLKVFHQAITYFGWGGVGVYFDTQFRGKFHVMFHFDIRPKKPDQLGPVIWWRDVTYNYPAFYNAMKEMYQRLSSI